MATDENGNTDLMQAVLGRNISEINRLTGIISDEEKEAVNNKGYTALMLATIHGLLKEMQALINGGVDIETTDSRGYTALLIGAEQNMLESLEKLRENGANMRALNEFGQTGIMIAAELNHLDAIEVLTEIESEENTEIMEITDGRGYTAIMLAAEQGHAPATRVLRANGANVNAVDNRGYNAVMIAAELDHANVIEALAEDMSTEEGEDLGVDLEARSNEDYTATMIAAKKNKVAALKVLLDNDANVDARTYDGGLTALIIALQRNKTEAALLLLEYGASVNSVEGSDEGSSEEGSDEGSSEKESDENSVKDDGLRPLMCASHHGNIDMIKRLMAKGANINDVSGGESGGGESALSAAVEAKKIEAIEFLAANGAEVSEVYENEELDRIIVANQPIFYLLNTAEIIDRIFAGEELAEQEEEFITNVNNQFNWDLAAKRLVSLCIINSEGDIDKAEQLFRDSFPRWSRIAREDINLSEVIAELLSIPTDYLNLGHVETLGHLRVISESLYEDAVGPVYKKRAREDDWMTLPRRQYVRTDRDEEDEESQSSTEIDEDNVSDGEDDPEELSGEEGENDANDTLASGQIITDGNTQATQQGSSSLNTLSDEQEKAEKQIVIVETKVEDNVDLNTWLETMFAGWGDMPQWMQDNIINSSPVQAILQSITEKEAIYNPKSIADKFAEIFVIEKRDDESESTQDNSNEKATCAKVPLELVDASFMDNAYKVGTVIVPILAGCLFPAIASGAFGKMPFGSLVEAVSDIIGEITFLELQ